MLGWRALSWLLIPLLMAGCGDQKSPATGRVADGPNIIVIVADDLSPLRLSAYGGTIPTPNIDRLAKEGVRFSHGYSAASVAGPALAALISGRYPQRFGYEFDNGPAMRDARYRLGLPVGVSTLADHLKTAGYQTYAVGKWHLGGNSEYYPTMRGFDDFFGILSGEAAYITPRAPDVHFVATPGHDLPPSRSWFDHVMRGKASAHVLNDDQYLTDAFADAAVGFINDAGDQPYLLYLAFTAPHVPLSVTDRYYQRFPDIADERERVYAAMVAALDDGVGRVLDALDEKGEANNSIVIFVSSNGCDAEAGVCPCAPTRGAKGGFFEGGVRVPFLLRWPEKISGNQVVDAPVSTLDIVATALGAVGAQGGDAGVEGLDLIPPLTGLAPLPPRRLFWQNGLSRAVLEYPWKAWFLPDGRILLYNLADDPGETNTLAEQNRDLVRALEARILEWRQANVPPKWPSRGRKQHDQCGLDVMLTE